MKRERETSLSPDVGDVPPPEVVVDAPAEKGGKLSAEEKLAKLEQGITDRETTKRGRKKKIAAEVVDMAEGNKKLSEKVKKEREKPGFKTAAETETKDLRAQQLALEQEAEKLSERAKKITAKVWRLRGTVTAEEEKELTETLAGAEEMEKEAEAKRNEAGGIKSQIYRIVDRHHEWEIQQQVTSNHPEEFAIEQVVVANGIEKDAKEIPEYVKEEIAGDVKMEKTRRKEEGWAEDAHKAFGEFGDETERGFEEAIAILEQVRQALDYQGDAGQELSAKVEALKQADSKLDEAKGAFFFKGSKTAEALKGFNARKSSLAEKLVSLRQDINQASRFKVNVQRGLESKMMFGSGISENSQSNKHTFGAYIGDNVERTSGRYVMFSHSLENGDIAEKIEEERARTVADANEKVEKINEKVKQVLEKIDSIAGSWGIKF